MISLFRGASLLTQILALGAMFIAAAGAYIAWKKHVEKVGWDKAIAAIAAQDKKAIDAATSARINYRACIANDSMRWDQSTGKCQRR